MKRAAPEKNVIYTFYYGERKIYKFLYIGTDEVTGRLRMFNVNSKTITTMPPARFSYIHRFNLLSEKPVKTVPCPEPTVKPVQLHIMEEEIDATAAEKELLHNLRSLPEDVRAAIHKRIGKTPEKLAEDLSHAGDNAEFSRFFSEYLKAAVIIQASKFSK